MWHTFKRSVSYRPQRILRSGSGIVGMACFHFHLMNCALFLLLHAPQPASNQEQSGSTPGLKEIFFARCGEYLKRESVQHFVEDRVSKCERIWLAWYEAFAFRDPCDVDITDYGEFMKLTDGPPLKNKVRRNRCIACEQALRWPLGTRGTANREPAGRIEQMGVTETKRQLWGQICNPWKCLLTAVSITC